MGVLLGGMVGQDTMSGLMMTAKWVQCMVPTFRCPKRDYQNTFLLNFDFVLKKKQILRRRPPLPINTAVNATRVVKEVNCCVVIPVRLCIT